MPRYFKTKAIMLHTEAYATFLLIEKECALNIHQGMIPDKMVRVYEMAEARVYRRFTKAYPKG